MWLTSSLPHLALGCVRDKGWREHTQVKECVGEFFEFYLLYEQQLIISPVIPHHITCTRSVSVCSSPYHEWAFWCVRFHGIHACACIFIEGWGRWWSSAVHLARHHMLDCDDWTLYGATEAAAGISEPVGVECKAILGFDLEYFVKRWAVCAFSQWECTSNLTWGNVNF